MLNPRSFRQKRFGCSGFPDPAEVAAANASTSDPPLVTDEYTPSASSPTKEADTSTTNDTSGKSVGTEQSQKRSAVETVQPPPLKKHRPLGDPNAGVPQEKIRSYADLKPINIDELIDKEVHIPGPGTTWNPSGLSDSHMKKLSCGFYGWEGQCLIKVTKTSNLFFHENQDCVNMAQKKSWIAPQQKYVDEELKPDDNGAHWDLKYCSQGCSCGWPYYLTRVPVLSPERRKCANFCCQREWEVHSTA